MDKAKCSECGKELVSGEQMRCVYCELNQVNVHSSTSADTNCGKCNIFTIRDKESLHCELCKRWYHNGCNEFALDDQFCSLVYEAPKNIKWFCDKCIWETEKWINGYTFNSDGHSEDITHVKGSTALDEQENDILYSNKNIKRDINSKRKPNPKRKTALPNGPGNKAKVSNVSLQTKLVKSKVKRITRNNSKKKTKSNVIKKEVDESDNEESNDINNKLTIKDENFSDVSSFEDDQEFQPGDSDTDSSYIGQDEKSVMKKKVNPGKKITNSKLKRQTKKLNIEKHNVLFKRGKMKRCDKCTKKFHNEHAFEAHMLYHETGERIPFKCLDCEKSFTLISALKRHVLRICKGPQNKTAIKTQIKSRKKSIKCPDCDKRFYGPESLQNHASFRHRKGTPTKSYPHTWVVLDKNLSCDKCTRTFMFKESFEAHNLWHAGDKKPFKCHICNKGFARHSGLKEHIFLHSDVMPIICEICGKGFTNTRNLKGHIYVCHSDEKPFSCSECDFKTKYKTGLDKHIRKMHEGFQCSLCDFQTRLRSIFRDHMKTHPVEKKLICDECGYRCKMLCELKNHKRTHSSDRPFKCELCEKTFKKRGGLRQHRTVHDKTKHFFCTVCEAGFPSKDGLNKHMRFVHIDEKQFECERCGNKYKTKHNLKLHQRGVRGAPCLDTNTHKQTKESLQKSKPSSESIASDSNSSNPVPVNYTQYNQQPPPLMVYTGGNNQPMAPVYSTSHVTATIHCPPPALSVFTGHYVH